MKKQNEHNCRLHKTVAFIALWINFALLFFVSYSSDSIQQLEDKVEQLQNAQKSLASSSWSNTLSSSSYPGCDTSDISVWSHIIAACNVWATQAGTWAESYGELFQAWRNKGFQHSDTSQQDKVISAKAWIDPAQDTYWFVWGEFLPAPFSWALGNITDNWWNITNTLSARQWPCATGYHVPSQNEWVSVVESWWWEYNSNAMSEALKLPLAGFRDWHYGNVLQKWTNGYYWSSSLKPTQGYYLSVHEYWVNTEYKGDFANGYSIRCFKN